MVKTRYCLMTAAAMSAALVTQSAFAFGFHGYLRSGAGSTSEGGDQVCFRTPGAPAKYRLGNECETYGEVQFDASVYTDESGAYFNTHVMFGFATGQDTDFEALDAEGNHIALRQAYVEGGNLVGGALEGATFWAGKRYYRRHDVHINDFYYWNNSGPGGGVEGIDLGFGKLAYAYRHNTEVDDDLGVFLPQVAIRGHDLRLYDLNVNPGGELTLGLNYGHISETDDAEAAGFDEGDNGYMVTVQHLQEGILGGYNKIALQWGSGAYGTFGLASPNGELTSDTHSWRVVEQLVWNGDRWSGMAAAIYQDSTEGNFDRWISAGIRPILHITQYFSLQAELGYDQIEPNDGDTRRLTKLTFAPTLRAGTGFFARPELRLFVTYADWNDAAAEAGVAGGRFGDDTDGLTFGIQAEAWW